ncbi:hypothetical protein C2845_PM11G03500 [Panicum miliaceum]|uniref:Secreted protein n=1 Tax=Panicum miliaceum TaxID=4540 RepID=A0A3L6RW33_PANMI|nr:hypothetical protein C2845_PM11G03500 [Panicum miliaceum]
MAKKIKLSLVMIMLAHWQKMNAGRSPIDITTLVTCIATHVKALDNAQVTYLPWEDEYQLKVGVEHFVQGHMMREGPGNSVFMTYLRYDREVDVTTLVIKILKSNVISLTLCVKPTNERVERI